VVTDERAVTADAVLFASLGGHALRDARGGDASRLRAHYVTPATLSSLDGVVE